MARGERVTWWRNTKEATLLKNIDDMQKLAQNNLDASVKSYGALAKTAQTIASEMADYSKKSFEDGGKAIQNLLSAKTPEQAVEIQTEFAKAAFEGYVAGLTKISQLYADLAKETFKSMEPNVSKTASMK
jgi:phasin family protein